MATITVSVGAMADVIVLKSGPASVMQGTDATFTITVTNAGPSAAVDLMVVDALPANLTFVSATGGATHLAGTVTWPVIAFLAEGASTSLVLVDHTPVTGLFTNVPAALSTTPDPDLSNNIGTSLLSQAVLSVGTPQFGTLAGPIVFNPQNGLMEQLVTVTNTGTATVAAFRVLVQGLRQGVTLFNASGSSAGTPYVQVNSPLDPGNTFTLRLEFFVPDRLPFTDTLVVEATLPQGGTVGGGGVVIDLSFLDNRIPGEPRFVIEFTSIPGRTYTVIYSDDGMATWKVATPSIVAGSTRTQWYDDGPTKTDSKPLSLNSRFYRVFLAPAAP